ncbi:MAG: OstA family protein [Deltaproteobacteria bacterium]|nr:OstA family protein [Deltaproteobacteria bacterium]
MPRMLIFFFLFLMAFPSHLAADETVPTRISADTMTYTQKSGTVEFSGQVQVDREDFTLWSDRLTVEFDPQGGRQGVGPVEVGGKVQKIVAEGQVRFSGQGREGQCGRAVYEDGPGVLTLTEDPFVQEGRNRIQGETIRLYLRENRSEVIGGQKRVEAIFHTPKRDAELP